MTFLSILFKKNKRRRMLDAVLRPVKEKLLNPFADVIGKQFGINPNTLTMISFVCGLGAIISIGWFHSFGWGQILWILNRIIDGLDGVVARRTGK